MPEKIDLFEAIDTQRGIRYFKPDPVPDELINRLLEAAVKAPSGGAKQGWSFIVIRDPETRRKIGDLYRAGSRFEIGTDLTEQARQAYGYGGPDVQGPLTAAHSDHHFLSST